MRTFRIYTSGSRFLHGDLAITTVVLILSRCCAAQGSPLGPPPPFKPVVSVRGGGVERNAPYRVPQRVVQGNVRNANEKGIGRAEVFLKDERTSTVRQLLADENGNYIFGGLPLEHDYQVWAKVGETTTPKRAVSSFTGVHDVTVNFHIPSDGHHTPETLTIETVR